MIKVMITIKVGLCYNVMLHFTCIIFVYSILIQEESETPARGHNRPTTAGGRTFINFSTAKQRALSNKAATKAEKRGRDLLQVHIFIFPVKALRFRTCLQCDTFRNWRLRINAYNNLITITPNVLHLLHKFYNWRQVEVISELTRTFN